MESCHETDVRLLSQAVLNVFCIWQMNKTLCSLYRSGNWSSSCKTRFTFVSNPCQELLDLSNSFARVETFRAGLGAVHDGVTSVHTERIPELVQSLGLVPVPAINDPPVGLHQHRWAKILVAIPPV